MDHIEWEITQEQYNEAVQFEDHSKDQWEVVEKIAGSSIVFGYGLYGYKLSKREVEGEEKYYLAMTVGSSCD